MVALLKVGDLRALAHPKGFNCDRKTAGSCTVKHAVSEYGKITGRRFGTSHNGDLLEVVRLDDETPGITGALGVSLEVLDLWRSGMTVAAIQRQVGVGHRRIRRLLRLNGLNPN